MYVRLTKKLAEVVNGIDLSRYSEGDVIELSEPQARILIAERWAEPASNPAVTAGSPVLARDDRAVAADRGYQTRDDEDGPPGGTVEPPES